MKRTERDGLDVVEGGFLQAVDRERNIDCRVRIMTISACFTIVNCYALEMLKTEVAAYFIALYVPVCVLGRHMPAHVVSATSSPRHRLLR